MNRNTLTIIAALGLAAFPGMAPADPAAATPLFNGKDLTGWKVPEGNVWWTATDGVLAGNNDPAKKGSMLYTAEEYGDFELEAEAKWTGEIDSGFMFRKKSVDEKIPGDLQMQIGVSRSLKKDMTGSFYIGKYPEEGQAKDGLKLLKQDDWNAFRIVAKGDTFTIFINGTQAVEYKDARYAKPGPIGLQIHGGLDMKVDFRNLKIRKL